MSTMTGADPDLLEVLARELADSAERLRAVQGQLGSVVQRCPWQGPDADRVRAEWEGRHRPAIEAVAADLAGAAAAATRNAAEQRRASAAEGGGAASSASFAADAADVADAAQATPEPAIEPGAPEAVSLLDQVGADLGGGLADLGGGLADLGGGLADVGSSVVDGVASFGNAVANHPEDVAALATGVGLLILGTGGEIGGFALDATGVGALGGVPLNIAAAGALATGGTLAAGALGNLALHATREDAVHPTSSGGSGSSGGSPELTNSVGKPYPEVADPRTGDPIPPPPRGLPKVDPGERVPWGGNQRYDYIKDWYDRGYPTPEGGWKEYDIHHIIPREYGGTNDFDNLVPVQRAVHQQEFNSWWINYG